MIPVHASSKGKRSPEYFNEKLDYNKDDYIRAGYYVRHTEIPLVNRANSNDLTKK